jgi:hypothetical protein
VPLSTYLQQRFNALMQRRSAVTLSTLQAQAQSIQQYMKANHRWTNQTGAAEAGLFASVTSKSSQQSEVFELTAGHGVDYGWALEQAMGGAYAIVHPTMTRTLKTLMPTITKVRNKTK